MAKKSREAKKPGSAEKSAETDERRDRRSGDKPERRLKKVIDRPIGQPEQAHEEVPIGWAFKPEGQQAAVLPDEGEGPPNASEDVAEQKAEGESTTVLADSSPTGGSEKQVRSDLATGTPDVSANASPGHSIGSGGVPSPAPGSPRGDGDRPIGIDAPDRGGGAMPLPPGGSPHGPGDVGDGETSGGPGGGDTGPGGGVGAQPPQIGGTAVGDVQEDVLLSISDRLTVSGSGGASWSLIGNGTGPYGNFTLNPDGSWSYTLDNDKAQGLKAGETVQEIFTVKVTDANGAPATQVVTITVNGTNDAPVISGTETRVVQEDEALTASGTLTVTDVDVGDTAAWSLVGSSEGQYGNLVLGDDGPWSYTLDNDAAQGLKAGETVQEIFTVKVTDAFDASDTQTITVTVVGTNDVPVISGTETGLVQEDEALTASGTLTASDADIGDTAAWSIVGSSDGQYGSLVLGDDGAWSYTLDSDTAQGLKAGETVQEIFTVQVTDASGASDTQTITVTIVGANDVPVISGTATGIVEEDGALTVGGALIVSDADIGDTASWSVIGDGAGSYGDFTLGADGQWIYALDNDAAQVLKAGDTAQEIFTIKVTDASGAETTQTITVTISGTNDIPVISGIATGAVAEDGVLTAGGRLDASDADVGDTATWSLVGDSDGSYGALTLNPDGSWSYALDNDAAQGLKAGDTVQEIFIVKVTDTSGAEVTQTVTVTVTGTNDAPTISGTETGIVQEDEVLIASGSLTVTDVDSGDTASWSLVGSSDGSYGSIAIGADGNWSYSLSSDAAQGLKAGETAQEIFTVKATDSSGASDTQTVTITVTGTNDAPVISGIATGSVSEDGTLTAGGKLDVFDADTGDTASWSVVGGDAGNYGSLSIDENGRWSYALDNGKAQGLKAGETAQETFTVRVTDAQGASAEQTITVTVSGTNDVPVIAGTATGQVQEDVTLTASGTLTAADADIGDTANWSIDGSAATDHGVFAIDPDSGQWTFTLDNDSVQGLKAGEVIRETFTVRATDSEGASETHLVSVEIAGTNDGPQVGQALNNMGSMKEDTSVTFSAEDLLRGAQVTDIDQDNLSITSVGLGGSSAPGTLVDNGDGTWTFTPNENVSNTDVGIVFQVSDGHSSVSAQASVAIQPVADPADVTISSSAQQEVIKTGDADDLGRIVAPQITTKQLKEFTLEFTVVGNSVPESTTGAGPVIVNIGSPPSDKNTLTLWDPANMKVGMSKLGGGDVNIPTGIDLTDGESHRVTVTFDGTTNTLKIYDNGELALTTQLPKPLPNTLYMAVAEKANTPPTSGNPSGGGYRPNEHFEGTIYNVAMSDKAETAAQVKDAPLAEQMEDNLLIDLRAQDGKIVDTTGRNSIKTGGDIDTDTVSVDTSLGSAPAGSVVSLDIDTKLGDPNDHISSLVVSGFVAGTIVSDGVHSVTVSGPKQAIDITDWSLDNLKADLPDGVRTSMDLKVTATTTTPPYETGEIDAQGQPVMATNSATSDEHHLLLVEGAGPPPPPSTDESVPAIPVPDGELPEGDETAVVPGGEETDTGGGTSEETTGGGQQPAKPETPEGGSSTTTAPPEGSTGTSDGGETVPGTAPPTTGTEPGGDGATVGPSTGGGEAGSGTTNGADTAPPIIGPVDASGEVTLVSVNDWYNPDWGGGYNATFQLTLTDDMLKGSTIEGWSLQIGVNNPNAVVTTGWLDGFNGTVSFDPSTGVFTNAGQDYQPELHAGDVIQFTIQVQNIGFNLADFSFSFQDLDPVPEGAAGSSAAVSAATMQDAGNTSVDIGGALAAGMVAEFGAGEQQALDAHVRDAPAAADADPTQAEVAEPTSPVAASSPSTAGAYLELVEPQTGNQASASSAADDQPSGAAGYIQMAEQAAQTPQEPPPPDHLFADAQIEHPAAPGTDAPDTQPEADHDAAAAAAAAPELAPAEDDQSNHGH